MMGETITLAAWPVYDTALEAPDAVKEMELLMEMIRAVRNIRAEVNVPMSKKIEMLIKPSGEAEAAILSPQRRIYQTFLQYV